MQRLQQHLNAKSWDAKMAFLVSIKSEPKTKAKIDALWQQAETNTGKQAESERE